MGTRAAKKARVEFLDAARLLLQSQVTDGIEREGIRFVEANLKESHMQAALWMERKHAMRIDAVNLGNLIAVWEDALTVSAMSAKNPQTLVLMVIDRSIRKGEFHPAYLLRYLRKNRTAVTKSTMPTRSPLGPTIH